MASDFFQSHSREQKRDLRQQRKTIAGYRSNLFELARDRANRSAKWGLMIADRDYQRTLNLEHLRQEGRVDLQKAGDIASGERSEAGRTATRENIILTQDLQGERERQDDERAIEAKRVERATAEARYAPILSAAGVQGTAGSSAEAAFLLATHKLQKKDLAESDRKTLMGQQQTAFLDKHAESGYTIEDIAGLDASELATLDRFIVNEEGEAERSAAAQKAALEKEDRARTAALKKEQRDRQEREARSVVERAKQARALAKIDYDNRAAVAARTKQKMPSFATFWQKNQNTYLDLVPELEIPDVPEPERAAGPSVSAAPTVSPEPATATPSSDAEALAQIAMAALEGNPVAIDVLQQRGYDDPAQWEELAQGTSP